MRYDVVIAGGGPAGLASAIALAQRGLRALVVERKSEPVDKACGEGLLPPALQALKRIGVRRLIDPSQCFPFDGIRLLNEDGSSVKARLPGEGGLGVRRVALISALMTRASQLGVELRDRCAVLGVERSRCSVTVETTSGAIEASLLVAADGLKSQVRRLAGLEERPGGPRRLALRQHFLAAPWSSSVEVHFAPGMEAYVTPLSPRMIGVAILWEDGRIRREGGFSGLLSGFPMLADRLRGAVSCSKPIGAGPMSQRSRAWVAHRLALVGDAGGYVDALTGEGLSLAFAGALALARIAPRAISAGGTQASLAAYAVEAARNFRRSAFVTRLMLMLARRPALRRRFIRGFSQRAVLLDLLVAWSILPPIGNQTTRRIVESADAQCLPPADYRYRRSTGSLW